MGSLKVLTLQRKMMMRAQNPTVSLVLMLSYLCASRRLALETKDYLTYMKEYIKNLKSKLEGTPAADKLPAIQKPLAELLKKFKDLQFFTGESMNPDGMVAIAITRRLMVKKD